MLLATPTWLTDFVVHHSHHQNRRSVLPHRKVHVGPRLEEHVYDDHVPRLERHAQRAVAVLHVHLATRVLIIGIRAGVRSGRELLINERDVLQAYRIEELVVLCSVPLRLLRALLRGLRHRFRLPRNGTLSRRVTLLAPRFCVVENHSDV